MTDAQFGDVHGRGDNAVEALGATIGYAELRRWMRSRPESCFGKRSPPSRQGFIERLEGVGGVSEEQSRLQAEMENMAFRKAFGELLTRAKEHSDKSWNLFAPMVGQTGKEVGDDLRHVANADRVLPWVPLVRSTVRYCAKAGLAVPERFASYRLQTREPKTPEMSPIVQVLGLKSTKSEESLVEYGGRYLLFATDNQRKIVVSTYLLSREVGQEGTPVFKAMRRRTKQSIQHFVGGYFANDHQLYLIGTPLKSTELRLAIFHVMPGEEQTMLRGAILRVSDGPILATRAMLIRANAIPILVKKTLIHKTHERESLPPILAEVADYLSGVDNPPYVSVSVGE